MNQVIYIVFFQKKFVLALSILHINEISESADFNIPLDIQ